MIIPVFNKEKTLERALRSALSQTYPDIEVIAVDDGSSDSSRAVIESFDEPHLIPVFKKNGGVSSARNAGLQAASGEYIAFLDADDWMEPDAIEKQVRLLEENGSDLVVTSFISESEKGSEPWLPDVHIVNKTPEESWETVYRNVLLNQPWNKLYRKEKIVQGFDESLSLGEDLLFVLSYLKNCRKITVEPLLLHHYEDSPEGLHVQKQSPQEFFRLYQAMIDQFGPFSDQMSNFLVRHFIRYCTEQKIPAKKGWELLSDFMKRNSLRSRLLIRPVYLLLSEGYKRK